nr:4510_t:CDS:2 [Entrophospora candida]
MSYIKIIQSHTEYTQLIASTKLTVVDFHATWCGPCHMIAPIFKELSEKYRHANFAKVDVDQHREVAASAGVTSMPTFKFFKDGKQIGEMSGANPEELRRLVAQHAASALQPGESSTLTINGHSDINEFITLNQIDCLNQQENNNVRNLFKKDDTILESDVDEQLLISIPLDLGFDETDSIEATQIIEVSEKDYEKDGGAIIPLRFVKFQSITNLVLFIYDNLGGEETTQLKELIFIGSPVETTKMENLKKIGEGQQ